MDRSVPRLAAIPPAVPWVAAGLAVLGLVVWLQAPLRTHVVVRVPGADRPPGETGAAASTVDVFARASLVTGPGKASELPGAWPQFRGPNLDGFSRETVPLARSWPGGKPAQLWEVEVGEGFAGPVVAQGRVFLMDYDRAEQRDALRCLSLADGAEIWRFGYPLSVKRNHGLTRTVPTVSGGLVVAMGPKCHVMAVTMETGKFQWGLDLVKDFGT